MHYLYFLLGSNKYFAFCFEWATKKLTFYDYFFKIFLTLKQELGGEIAIFCTLGHIEHS